MADLSDVMDAMADIATAACYPNGTDQASITGAPINIGQGWPKPTDLDTAFQQDPPQTWVTVYAVPGTSATVVTPFDWSPGIIAAPSPGLTASLTDNVLTFTGTLRSGEVATVIINGTKAYSYAVVANDTAASVAAVLSAQIAADFPGTTASAGVLTIAGAYSIAGRTTVPATLGQIIHRQRQNIQVSVWAPSPADRSTIAAAVDVALKQSLSIEMPDTSTAIIVATGTNIDDNSQNRGDYTRHLIFAVQWDTVSQYAGHEITSINIGFESPASATSSVQ